MGITMVHFLANINWRHSSQLLAKQHGHGCGYGYGIGYVAWKSHIMVLLEEFCVKVYFWPFLSYLASIKGWCPLYPPAQTSCYDARSRPGSCLPLTSCSHLVEEYQSEAPSAGSNDFQTFLGRSICGFDGSTFLVCCATDRSSNGRSRKDLQVTTTAASGVFHFSPLGGGSGNPIVLQPTPPLMQGQVVIRPSPNNPAPTQPPPQPQPQPQTPPQQMLVCGISGATSNRVVGGQEARRGAYPWIAALGYFEESNRNSLKFLCGGSLIHSHYVITSAHCINGLLTLVRLGAHDLSKPTEAGAMDFRIRRTVIHEQFDMTSIANDIALIELSGMTSATLTANIAPICLPEAAKFLQQDFVGMNPFIAGWGASKHQGPTSQVLRDVQVPIVARQSCEQSYKSVFRFVQFSDKVICAGSSSVDACQGDSGGPLMMPQLEGNGYRFYLLGLVSFGYECARPNFPGVYTRVASYVPWIRQQISMG